MSSLLNTLVRIGEFATNDDLVLDPEVPKPDTVAPAPPATVPEGWEVVGTVAAPEVPKVAPGRSVRHSKSSSSLLEPVPEQSSEDSLDSKGRRELQKSLSTVNFKSLVPDRPPIPEYDEAKEWNGSGILKKKKERRGSLDDDVCRDNDRESNGSSGILKKKERRGSLDDVEDNGSPGILKSTKKYEKNQKLKRSFSAKILKRIGSLGKKPRGVEKSKSADGAKENGKKRAGSIKRLRRAVSFHDEDHHRSPTPESDGAPPTPKSSVGDSESLSSIEVKQMSGFKMLKRALSLKNGRARNRKERRGSLDAVYDGESNGSGILKKRGGFKEQLRRAVSFHNQSTSRLVGVEKLLVSQILNP